MPGQVTRRSLLGTAVATTLLAGCGPSRSATEADPVHGRTPRWRAPFPFVGGADDAFGAKLVTVAPRLVLAGHGGKLYAFDPATGKPRWTSPYGPYDETQAVGTPAVITGSVVVTVHHEQQGTTLSALDTASGRRLWQTAGGAAVPAATAGLVYYPVGRDLCAFDARTGRVRWKYHCTGPGTAETVVAGSNVYVNDGAHVAALKAATGHVRWRHAAGPVRVLADAGSLVLLSDRLKALDPHTGRVRHTGEKLQGALDGARDATLADGTVYLVNTGGEPPYLWALDAATGRTRWTFTGAHAIQGPASPGSGTVYVGDSGTGTGGHGGLYALDARTGRSRWTADAGKHVVDAPTAAAGTVYAVIAASPSDYLYALPA